MLSQFITGMTYATRSNCDHNCIIRITIAKRTAKTITTTEGKTFRCKPTYNGFESVSPWGSYSMAPIITAEQQISN